MNRLPLRPSRDPFATLISLFVQDSPHRPPPPAPTPTTER